MYICTGNICRSAMAHKLLEKKLKDNNISNVEVYSCGVFAENGDTSTYAATEVMKEYDVDMSTHRATHISNSNIKDMDLILCATFSHKRSVLQMYPELDVKLFTIKEYVCEKDCTDLDIKDPWGYDIEIYRFCAAEIEACIDKLLDKLK